MAVDILLDDFLDTMKEWGSGVWSTAKQFIADNKPQLKNMLSNLLSSYLGPVGNPIADLAFTSFGG
jgi:hypothetical protein